MRHYFNKNLNFLKPTLALIIILFGTGANAAVTPATALASIIGYLTCLKAAEIDGVVTEDETRKCNAIGFDPVVDDVSTLSLSLVFDPNQVQFSDEVFSLEISVMGVITFQ